MERSVFPSFRYNTLIDTLIFIYICISNFIEKLKNEYSLNKNISIIFDVFHLQKYSKFDTFNGVGICTVNLVDDMKEYMRGIFLVM